jgi:hypothetical protein
MITSKDTEMDSSKDKRWVAKVNKVNKDKVISRAKASKVKDRMVNKVKDRMVNHVKDKVRMVRTRAKVRDNQEDRVKEVSKLWMISSKDISKVCKMEWMAMVVNQVKDKVILVEVLVTF